MLFNFLERTSGISWFSMVTWCSDRVREVEVSGWSCGYYRKEGKELLKSRQRQGCKDSFVSHSRSLWPHCWVSGFRTDVRFFTPSFRSVGNRSAASLRQGDQVYYQSVSEISDSENGWLSSLRHRPITCAKRRKMVWTSSSPADGPH